jgi:hypothetical protein
VTELLYPQDDKEPKRPSGQTCAAAGVIRSSVEGVGQPTAVAHRPNVADRGFAGGVLGGRAPSDKRLVVAAICDDPGTETGGLDASLTLA